MGVELIICRMRKFCPRKLRVGSVSRRRGIILPRLIPFEAEDSVYVARYGEGLEFRWTPWQSRVAPQVTMSSSHRPGKEVATSSNRKRVRSRNVPPASALPRGQTRRFGVKVVTKEGKGWYKKHTETTYFSDVCVDGDSLAREFPQIQRLIRELGMEFIFADPDECNLHMVWEFYANWAPEVRSHYVTVRGKNVPITPTGINDILGTPQDTDPLVLTGLNIRPLYQAICHMLCGP
ncbi:hypothetical protein KY284_001809 [Solanum tuberosum]|nr:hypothetical protein KY284_001809 [Solanum tuberosum]